MPLPILLALLLLAGTSVSLSTILALIGCLIVIVSLLVNVGHALNELFDREEDHKAGPFVDRGAAHDVLGESHVLHAIAFLLRSQRSDGSWAAYPFYSGPMEF